MKYILIALTLLVSTSTICLAQTKNQPDPAEITAKKETEKWQKLLNLNEPQKDRVFVICLTFAQHDLEIDKTTGKRPPAQHISSEKDRQFKDILTAEQYNIYIKEVQKDIPPLPVKNNAQKHVNK